MTAKHEDRLVLVPDVHFISPFLSRLQI
jgi:hypothetical protein